MTVEVPSREDYEALVVKVSVLEVQVAALTAQYENMKSIVQNVYHYLYPEV